MVEYESTLSHLSALRAEIQRLREMTKEQMKEIENAHPIETAPHHQKIIGWVPCYGHYNKVGELRGYIPIITEFVAENNKPGFWFGARHRPPTHWHPIPLAPKV